ncbi:MAG: hypothetical protein HZA17_11005 [Nitrospirae bacterium]|nr:hypothetical protein [Nitrospirota bacterium]
MHIGQVLILFLFSSVFFLISTTPIVEGDIFWHIKTGEWIWANLSIPDHDMFTYTSQKIDPMRPESLQYTVVLKGYWLSQPIFYLIDRWLGVPGIILFRAFMIVLILLMLYFWMRRLGAGFNLSLLILFLIGYEMRYMGDRPHYFSFLFFPLAAMLLESIRGQCKAGIKGTPSSWLRLVAPLPVLMLAWANMHGGFVTGATLICIYAAGELISFILRRKEMQSGDVRSLSIFFLICLISVAATFVSPNTYKTYTVALSLTGDNVLTHLVIDHISPITAARLLGDYKPTYWLLIFFTAVVLFLRIRTVDISRLLALSFFSALSLSVLRSVPFYLTLTPLIVVEIENILRGRFKRLLAASLFMVMTILILKTGIMLKDGSLLNFSLEDVFPVHAVEFIKHTRPKGNLFNPTDWGGYLMLNLSGYQVFDDGRRLMTDVVLAGHQILGGMNTPISGVPAWRAYLDSYKVDIILIPSVSPAFIDFYPVVKELYLDSHFVLVYSDKLSLVYLRRGENNQDLIGRYALPRELSLMRAINRLHIYKTEEEMKEKYRLIGDLYLLMGRHEAAEQYHGMLKK